MADRVDMDKTYADANGWRSWLTSRRVTKTFPGTLVLALVLLIVTLAVSILAVPKESQDAYVRWLIVICIIAPFWVLGLWLWRFIRFLPSDEEIANKAIEIAKAMRELEARQWQKDMRNMELSRRKYDPTQPLQERGERYGRENAEDTTSRDQGRLDFCNQYLADAVYYRDEMMRRLKAPKDDAYRDTMRTFEGQGSGPFPIAYAANYLDVLARRLLYE